MTIYQFSTDEAACAFAREKNAQGVPAVVTPMPWPGGSATVKTGTETAREQLHAIYMDYFNNYLSSTRYGENNGLTEAQATTLLTLAREINHTPHPEA